MSKVNPNQWRKRGRPRKSPDANVLPGQTTFISDPRGELNEQTMSLVTKSVITDEQQLKKAVKEMGVVRSAIKEEMKHLEKAVAEIEAPVMARVNVMRVTFDEFRENVLSYVRDNPASFKSVPNVGKVLDLTDCEIIITEKVSINIKSKTPPVKQLPPPAPVVEGEVEHGW